MTEGRAKILNRYLREYDSKLYAKARYGRIDILRRCEKFEAYDMGDWTLLAPRPNDYLVMSLTTNWNIDGTPVDWGVEPLMKELKSRDLWKRDYVSDLLRAKEELEGSKDRDMDNNLEAFWKDNRRAWAKNFEHVNRSSLSRPDRRYRDDINRKMKGI